MSRTRRVILGLAAAAGSLSAVAGPMAAPASAASATYTVYRNHFTPAAQMSAVGTSAAWVNRDTVAHHLVGFDARSTGWTFDVLLQPGQSFYLNLPATGRFLFRDADRSRLSANVYGNMFCSGQCGSVLVRSA